MSTVTTATEVAPVRPGEGLDWRAIDAFVRARVPGLAGELTVLQFPNGAANLTYLLRYGDRELVLRRPPFGAIAPGAHDMKREFKVLSRLWQYTRLAPRAYALCDDAAVCGADFFVMERRTGVVVRSEIPPEMRHHENVGRRVGFAIVDAMAELHRLDPAACGLADLGKPEGFAARQVAGWRKRWSLVRPADDDGLMDAIGAQLAATVPAAQRIAFVHNDLKPDNVQFDPADPDRAKSIFDWDMTTIGDPLIDLGTLIQYWPDASDSDFATLTSQPGMLAMGLPSRAEVAARYSDRTGARLDALAWWTAFAYWKTAVVVMQLYTRYLRGESRDARMVAIGERAPRLARKAALLVPGVDFVDTGR
jgi:aminoglycoside phosphotransferase (APT) family kinase protein